MRFKLKVLFTKAKETIKYLNINLITIVSILSVLIDMSSPI